jgi:uncharacterized protein YndB with AHSA1/START domain
MAKPRQQTGTGPSLVHSIFIACTPEAAWQALLDPDLTRLYFYGLTARSTWERDARVVFEDPDGVAWLEGQVLDLQPARRLRIRLRVLRNAETAADLPSRVTWEITPATDGCTLTVVHDEFDGETPSYQVVRSGWPGAVAGLKELLETGAVITTLELWPAEALARLDRPGPVNG